MARNLTAKQLNDTKMLIIAKIDGIIVYHRQDITDIEIDKIERKALILSANINIEKPRINPLKNKIDRTSEINNFLNQNSTGNGGK